MRLLTRILGLLPVLVAGNPDVWYDATVTVTVTQTFTTCPWTCNQLASSNVTNSGLLGTTTFPLTTTTSAVTSGASSTVSPILISTTGSTTTLGSTTSLTSTTSSAGTTPSGSVTTSISTTPTMSTTTTSPSTTPATTTTTTTTTTTKSTTTTASGTIISPGTAFTPSAQLSSSIFRKRAGLDTVYIDMIDNTNRAQLTTDITKAAAFTIGADGTLSATFRSYPYTCGSSDYNNTPGIFSCDDGGIFYQTYRGWTNSPTFTYKDWTFCYDPSTLWLYMSSSGPTTNCIAITFVTSAGGTPSGSA